MRLKTSQISQSYSHSHLWMKTKTFCFEAFQFLLQFLLSSHQSKKSKAVESLSVTTSSRFPAFKKSRNRKFCTNSQQCCARQFAGWKMRAPATFIKSKLHGAYLPLSIRRLLPSSNVILRHMTLLYRLQTVHTTTSRAPN